MRLRIAIGISAWIGMGAFAGCSGDGASPGDFSQDGSSGTAGDTSSSGVIGGAGAGDAVSGSGGIDASNGGAGGTSDSIDDGGASGVAGSMGGTGDVSTGGEGNSGGSNGVAGSSPTGGTGGTSTGGTSTGGSASGGNSTGGSGGDPEPPFTCQAHDAPITDACTITPVETLGFGVHKIVIPPVTESQGDCESLNCQLDPLWARFYALPVATDPDVPYMGFFMRAEGVRMAVYTSCAALTDFCAGLSEDELDSLGGCGDEPGTAIVEHGWSKVYGGDQNQDHCHVLTLAVFHPAPNGGVAWVKITNGIDFESTYPDSMDFGENTCTKSCN